MSRHPARGLCTLLMLLAALMGRLPAEMQLRGSRRRLAEQQVDGPEELSPWLRAPVLQLCENRTLCMAWKTPVKWLPTVQELNHLTREEKSQRTIFFVVSGLTATLMCAASIEMLQFFVKKVIVCRMGEASLDDRAGYRTLAVSRPESATAGGEALLSEEAERNEEHEVSGQEKALTNSIGTYSKTDVAFVYYHCLYTVMCSFLVAYGMRHDLLSQITGLDFELYGIWQEVVLGVHFVTSVVACIVACRAGDVALLCSGMAKKVAASLVPLVSELVDGLRDPITVAIFLQSETVIGYICAALTVIGMLLPSMFIFSDPAILRGLRHAYWPALTHVDAADMGATAATTDRADESNKMSETGYFESGIRSLLAAADAATSPHRQELTLEEESFQAAAGLLFSFSTQLSPLILLTTTVAVAKIACTLLLRRYILGWMASFGIPWKQVTTSDVEGATACSGACSWEARSKAARAVAADASNGTEVRLSAMKSLTELLLHQSNADPDKLQKHKQKATACFTWLMRTQSLKAEAEQRLEKLGPYNPADMLALHSVSMHWGELRSSSTAGMALTGLGQEQVKPFGYIFAKDVAKLMQRDDTRKAALGLLCSLERAALPHKEQIMNNFTVRPEAISLWYRDLMLAGCTEECNSLSDSVTELLSKTDKKTQKAAAEAMRGFVQSADSCIEKLVTMACNDTNATEVRQTALGSVASLWIYGEATKSEWLSQKMVDILSQFQESQELGVSQSVSSSRVAVSKLSTKLENYPLIFRALQLLCGLGDASAQAAPVVVGFAKSEDVSVQQEALKFLVNMGAAGKPYSKQIVAVVKELVKEKPQERASPLRSRFQLTDELATFVVELFGHDSADLKCAAASLVQFFDVQKAGGTERFVALLEDKDRETRVSAVGAFPLLGDAARKHATALVPLFKDPYYWARWRSPEAMTSLGDAAKPHASAFVEQLFDDIPDTSQRTLERFPELGALMKDGVRALVSGLSSSLAAHRTLHAKALGSLRGLAAAHVEDLARCLNDPEISVRVGVFQALRNLGWHAAGARDEVARHLESQSEDVRREVIHTLISLGKVPPQLAEGICAEFQRTSNRDTLKTLIGVLPKIQYEGGNCSSHLKSFLQSEELRDEALRTLPRLGKTGAEIAHDYWQQKSTKPIEDISEAEALMLPQIDAVLEKDLSAQLLSGQLLGPGRTTLNKAAMLAGQHCKISDDTAKRLLEQLQKPELEFRDLIAMTLLNAQGASKDLCQLALSNDSKLQLWGLRAMSCSSALEWDGQSCLDILAKAFKGSNVSVRMQALASIGEKISEEGSRSLSNYFVQLVRQSSSDECKLVSAVLKQLSQSDHLSCAAKLWRLVESTEVETIERALHILSLLMTNRDNKCLPFEDAFVRYLSHTNARVRAAAARLISALGDGAAKHQPALKKLLSDASGDVRAAGVQSIGKFRSGGKVDISHAEAEMLLTRGKASDRKRTARALAGALGWELAKKLIEHEEIEIQAGALLGLSEPGMDYAIMDADKLKTLLKNCTPEVRGGAARLLGLMGARAKGTATLLAQMVSDEAQLSDLVLRDGVELYFECAAGYAPGLYSVCEMDKDEQPVIFKHDTVGYKVTFSHYHNATDRISYSMTVGNVAERALQRMGKDAKDAIPELERMLQQGSCKPPTALRQLLVELKEAQEK